MKNNKGFTLIELLVVVLIIGILAAIALPQYMKAVRKSRAAEALIAIKSLKDAADRYALAYGSLEGITAAKLDVDVADTSNYEYTVTSTQITAAPPTGEGATNRNTGGVTLCYKYTASDASITQAVPLCAESTNSVGVCTSLGAAVTVGTC